MSAYEFFKEQFFGQPVAPTQSLEGRIVVITGGNCGLGQVRPTLRSSRAIARRTDRIQRLQTAIHLARLNPKKVIITSRDAKKGEAALKTIEEACGYTSAEAWELDLASFKSVKVFAERCKSLERLDCVVENAGVTSFDWKQTEDGWEQILQVNDIATGLLGVLLLPLLEKATTLPVPTGSAVYRPHLTIVASEVHAFAKFTEAKTDGSVLEALNDKDKWVGTDRYNISKLINLYIAQGISQLPAASGVTVNVVNPGLCKSEFRRDFKGGMKVLGVVLDLMARTGECGARNIAFAAVEETPPAAYVSVSEVKTPGTMVTSEEGKALSAKIWKELVEVWQKVAPETVKLLKG